jgi:hypothetical protein
VVDRLREVVVAAGIESLDHVAGIGPRGHENDGNMPMRESPRPDWCRRERVASPAGSLWAQRCIKEGTAIRIGGARRALSATGAAQ